MAGRSPARGLLALLLALASLTAIVPAGTASPTTSHAADPPRSAALEAGLEPRPVIQHLPGDAYENARVYEGPAQPLAFPPSMQPVIHPGRELLIELPDEDDDARCTMNFVYEDVDTDAYYVGTAGHCLLPEDVANSTEPGFQQPNVKVCLRFCLGAGSTNQTSEYVELGDVLYARRSHEGEALGQDYAFVEVPEDQLGFLDPEVPVWGGPAGAREEVSVGEPVETYGQGAGFGDADLDARSGLSTGSLWVPDTAFSTLMPAAPGDSGGPILSETDAFGSLGEPERASWALGDLTHFYSGLIVGTFSAHGVQLAEEATDVSLRLVTDDSTIAS